jgi:hypothetical protein
VGRLKFAHGFFLPESGFKQSRGGWKNEKMEQHNTGNIDFCIS